MIVLNRQDCPEDSGHSEWRQSVRWKAEASWRASAGAIAFWSSRVAGVRSQVKLMPVTKISYRLDR